MSLRPCSTIERRTRRPMRPKPLMATRTVMRRGSFEFLCARFLEVRTREVNPLPSRREREEAYDAGLQDRRRKKLSRIGAGAYFAAPPPTAAFRPGENSAP